MMLAHKIALDPTDKQRSYFARASGTARFAYNWALAEWKRQHAVGGKPSEVSLRRQLNSMKREQYPWMFDVTKCAAQEAIIDLGTAFRSFFEKRGKDPRFKYPRFKKKGTHDSFCAANEAGTFRCESKRIKLPVIGWVRMREAVRFQGPFKRVTVSREADRWFASIMVETSAPAPVMQPNEVVGVELGVSVLATLSQGEPIVGPKAHKALLKRFRRSNRALSRKKRGSRNAARAKRRLAKLHARIANIRKDVTHKATTALAKAFGALALRI
jgi:putative transposase